MLTLIDSVIASKSLYQELLNPICKKYNLTESEILILLYLASNPKKNTATDIVEKQGLKKSLVSVSVKDLLKRELVAANYLNDNHRSIHLELTKKAQDIINEAKKIQDNYYRILLDDFDGEERRYMRKCFDRMVRNIDVYRNR